MSGKNSEMSSESKEDAFRRQPMRHIFPAESRLRFAGDSDEPTTSARAELKQRNKIINRNESNRISEIDDYGREPEDLERHYAHLFPLQRETASQRRRRKTIEHLNDKLNRLRQRNEEFRNKFNGSYPETPTPLSEKQTEFDSTPNTSEEEVVTSKNRKGFLPWLFSLFFGELKPSRSSFQDKQKAAHPELNKSSGKAHSFILKDDLSSDSNNFIQTYREVPHKHNEYNTDNPFNKKDSAFEKRLHKANETLAGELNLLESQNDALKIELQHLLSTNDEDINLEATSSTKARQKFSKRKSKEKYSNKDSFKIETNESYDNDLVHRFAHLFPYQSNTSNKKSMNNDMPEKQSRKSNNPSHHDYLSVRQSPLFGMKFYEERNEHTSEMANTQTQEKDQKHGYHELRRVEPTSASSGKVDEAYTKPVITNESLLDQLERLKKDIQLLRHDNDNYEAGYSKIKPNLKRTKNSSKKINERDRKQTKEISNQLFNIENPTNKRRRKANEELLVKLNRLRKRNEELRKDLEEYFPRK